ncbi:hypothetical protein [Sphingomonas radiodurans]|nr:hypothetical protein [Sphingomonas radiodurans]WBH18042.1 hypothetical protein LLW23_08105 [Sphingomonas radiodurans]
MSLLPDLHCREGVGLEERAARQRAFEGQFDYRDQRALGRH